MAQYTIITSGDPIILSDGVDTFRLDVRDNVLYFDQEITSLGFGEGSVEDTDWGNIDSSVLPDDPGLEFRVGVRDGHWVIDQTYDPDILGFEGLEFFDWENLEKHQL